MLELGGKCPVIVDEDADLEYSSSKLAFTKTLNSGQVCVATDYVFVHESKVNDFTKTVQLNFRKMFGEKPEGTELQGKIINEFHTERL